MADKPETITTDEVRITADDSEFGRWFAFECPICRVGIHYAEHATNDMRWQGFGLVANR